MIKGRAGPLVVIGLSRMNVDRLMAGMPISFDGSEVGVPGIRLVIFGGETEPEMFAELRRHGLITPETKVTDDFTGKGNH